MKFSEKESDWFWNLEQDRDVEVFVAGDATSPCPERIEILDRVVAALDSTKRKAENLLRQFIKEDGELELTGIHLSHDSEKLDCDFFFHYVFLPAADPRRYDTYFDVCFSSQPDHPHEDSRLHPFKFVVGFY